MLKSCEKTCQLLSQQADRHLKWYEKLQLKFHLSMCYGCRRYGRQIDGIEAGMKQLRQQHSSCKTCADTADGATVSK